MRRIIAAVALVAQVVMVFAPMGDLCNLPQQPTSLVAAVAGGAVIGTHQASKPHDPATCPACIAQSLHAQLAPVVSIPTLISASRSPVDLRTTFVAHRGLPSSHQSRAPPVRS